MPKHDTRNLKSKTPEEHRAENVQTLVEMLSQTKIVALIDAKIYVTGKYSGREYVFNGAGSVVDVDNRDVQWMLEKRQGERQCCGGTEKGNVMFALAEV